MMLGEELPNNRHSAVDLLRRITWIGRQVDNRICTRHRVRTVPLVVSEARKSRAIAVVAFLNISAVLLCIADEFFAPRIMDTEIVVAMAPIGLERRKRDPLEIFESLK